MSNDHRVKVKIGLNLFFEISFRSGISCYLFPWFEDNAAVVLKDDKGTPKGTILKGPIAKEACERWPGISKLASIIV